MIKILGENYFIDLDRIEKYVDMGHEELSGNTEMRINIVKYELVKMMVEVVLSDELPMDDNLGIKNRNNTSLPFSLAFNSLLNKKIIQHY
jgi:hypothetical protein